MEETKKRSLPINRSQRDLLIEFMRNHPELRSGRFSSTFTFKKAKELWMEVTDILNAIPGGSNKVWTQWRKTWQDYKKNTKSKVAKYNRDITQTGGGPPPPNPTEDSNETGILDLMSETEINGLPSVTECGAEFFFDNVHMAEEEKQEGQSPIQAAAANGIVENEIVLEDHSYNIFHPTPSTSRMKRTPTKLNKTRRLENSQKISQNFLKSVDRREQILENYYNKKIDYMEHKKNYDQQHLLLMREDNENCKKILETLQLVLKK